MNPIELRMPAFPGARLITLVRWCVPDGGHVEPDDPICKVEFDTPAASVQVELPSPVSGTIEQLVPDGATLHENQLLGWLIPGTH